MRLLPLLLLPLLLLPARAQEVEEARVYRLPLEGEWSQAEFSGMAWHGDRLLLLPQFPERFAPVTGEGPDGMLWVLEREVLREAVHQAPRGRAQPLRPRPFPFYDSGLRDRIEGYEGYEALAISGDTVFVTIEARGEGGMYGYLATGHIGPDAVRLDPLSLTPIPPPQRGGVPLTVSNMSYEALALVGRRALVFYEANGDRLADRPAALELDLGAGDSTLRPVPFPRLEYRITDATPPDADGRFWVLNTFWPGDAVRLAPARDVLAARYGYGWTHERSPVVERLVELQITDDGVVEVPRAPIVLRLLPGGVTRNWEGIAPFEGGFLLVTDAYPDTRLAFVRPPKR